MVVKKRRWAGCAGSLAAFLVAYVVLSNVLPGGIAHLICPWKPIVHAWRYESSDGGFEAYEWPEKGVLLEGIVRRFEEYRSQHPGADIVLFRTSAREFKAYYDWGDFLTHPRWDIPWRPEKGRPVR